MINFEDYINSVEARLKDHRYQVVRDEKLPDNSTCELVATRRYFSWKGFVMLRQYVFVNYITKPTVEESRALFEIGLQYAKKRSFVFRVRGMQTGGIIVPCIVSPSIPNEVMDYVEKPPPKHWALFEFPVFYDLSTGQTLYYRKTAMWGGAYFSDFRKLVENCLKGTP